MATTIQVVTDLKLKREIKQLAKAENRTLSTMAEMLLAEALRARQVNNGDSPRAEVNTVQGETA